MLTDNSTPASSNSLLIDVADDLTQVYRSYTALELMLNPAINPPIEDLASLIRCINLRLETVLANVQAVRTIHSVIDRF